MFKNKLIIFFLVIFYLMTFGILFSPTPSLAVAQCDDKADTGYCTGKDIQLQIGIPGLSKIGLGSHCSYSVKVSEDKEETRDVYCIKGFPQYIKAIYNIFIGVVGILAVIMIMVGGFQWLLAAGNDQKISGAKTTIVSAVMGLILALTSYTILSIVNPKVLNLSLSVPDVSLSDRKTTGLCKAGKDGDQPILRKDDAPMCGKTYIKLKKNKKTGEDEYCAGYVYEVPLAFKTGPVCYFDGNSTQETEALMIEDSRKDGFGSRVWTVMSGQTAIEYTKNGDIRYGKEPKPGLACGKLYITCKKKEKGNELKWGYAVGAYCPTGNTTSEQVCVIEGGDDHKADFNVKPADIPGTACDASADKLPEVGSINGYSGFCKSIIMWQK